MVGRLDLSSSPAPYQPERSKGTQTKGKKWGSIRHGYSCDYARLAAGTGVEILRSKSGLAGLAFAIENLKDRRAVEL